MSVVGTFTVRQIRRAAGIALVLAGAACSQHPAIDEADDLAAQSVVLARTGQLEAALDGFERALALDSANLRALYNGGLAALELHRLPLAEQRLAAFLRLQPDDALGHLQIARVHAARGERDAAFDELRNAVRLGLADPTALDEPELAPLRSDLRFVQAKVLVAQRSGTRAVDAMGRLLVGDKVLEKVQLPGDGAPEAACEPAVASSGERSEP